MRQILAHVRSNIVAYCAVAIAVAGSGGYALAATSTKTINACASRKTGLLYLRNRRCKRGQTRVSWNVQGTPGAQGKQGPAGTPAVSAWAYVAGDGFVVAGQGISVARVSAGDYQITVTASACQSTFNAPVVSVSDSYPPNGEGAGAFPVAWVGDSASSQFNVDTGVVVNGQFQPTDHTFNVQDTCS
jgi:hypothetical protein